MGSPTAPASPTPWSAAPEEVAQALASDLHRGLSGAEARARLERHGRNELAEERPVPSWRRVVAQLRDPLTLLLAAAALSLVVWFLEGRGTPARAQTLAFTTLVLFQLWNVFAARSDVRSALLGLGTNLWLVCAVAVSVFLQALVVYWPPLQRAFRTVPLSSDEWAGRGADARAPPFWHLTRW